MAVAATTATPMPLTARRDEVELKKGFVIKIFALDRQGRRLPDPVYLTFTQHIVDASRPMLTSLPPDQTISAAAVRVKAGSPFRAPGGRRT